MRTPRFAAVRAGYDRALRQRGALLKSLGAAARSARGSEEVQATLDVWDGQLAAAGAELVAARRRLVAELSGYVALAYERVSGGQGAAVMTYRSSTADTSAAVPVAHDERVGVDPGEPAHDEVAAAEAELLEAMARLRRKEIERGVCLVGPHRDDLVLSIGGLPARGYASHGESWSLALALRLASYDLLRDDTSGEWSEGGEPVLILDDVFAELDARRRDHLARLVGGAQQVLVTAAAAEDVPPALVGARFEVVYGTVTRVP
jgi:DNA replication and repair protein RecF